MLSVYPPAPPGGSDDQLYHLAGFSRTPRIPGLRGTTFNGSLYSGFLAQLVALLSSLNGYPNRPENKPRRSHHRPRRLQPSARPLPGAYHFQLSTKSSIPGRYSAPNETQAQSILGNVVPATSRGRRLHPPDTPPPHPGRDYSAWSGCNQSCGPSVEAGPSPEEDSGCPLRSEIRELHFPGCPARSRSRQPRFAWPRQVGPRADERRIFRRKREEGGARGAGGVSRPRKLCMR